MLHRTRSDHTLAASHLLQPRSVRRHNSANIKACSSRLCVSRKIIRSQPGQIAAQKLTRINYAFANLQGSRIVNGYTADDKNLAALVALKQENPSLTVLVSVGGWLWSGNFSDMALTKQAAASLSTAWSSSSIATTSMDWTSTGNIPARSAPEITFAPKTSRTTRLLLKELAQTLRPAGKEAPSAPLHYDRDRRLITNFSHTPRWAKCKSMSIPSI